MEYELDFHNRICCDNGSEVARYDTCDRVILLIKAKHSIRFVLFGKNESYIEKYCDHCYKDDPHYWIINDQTVMTTSLKTALEELDNTFWSGTDVDREVLLQFTENFIQGRSIIEKDIIKDLLSDALNNELP